MVHNKSWVSTDETTNLNDQYAADVTGTFIAEHPGEVFLLVSQVLETANHSVIALLFYNAMTLL
jgi:hypothetical protein